MAPPKKPLFDPPPPTTLDQFFAKPGNLKIRGASSHVQKCTKAIPVSSRIKQKTRQKPPPGAEIIDLGSDDDAPVACTKRKTIYRSGSSSDIEVVEAVTHQANDASSIKRVKTDLLFGSQDLFTHSQDSSLLFSEFGKPTLLVPDDEDEVLPATEGENVQAGTSSSMSAERQSHLSAPDPPAADSPASSCPLIDNLGDASAVPSTSSEDNVIDMDDDWGTGDDELVRTNEAEMDNVLELTDDDEIEEALKLEDEPAGFSGDNLDQCPFCGKTSTSLSSTVSSFLQSTVALSHGFRIRICSRILMSAVTHLVSLHFPQPLLSLLTIHPHHQHNLKTQGQLVATRSRYSCPRTKRMMPGRKPRSQKTAISVQQKHPVGEERHLFTRSCRVCPLPSMHFVMGQFLG